MSDRAVSTRIDGTVLVIELSRPDRLNALTRGMLTELHEALDDARQAAVGAVVLTGAGRGFCAGQDLDEVLADPQDEHDRLRTSYHPVIVALHGLDKPTVAAINGVCAGAGVSLAACCDFRLASEQASFAPAFIDLGLVPDAGASWLLPRLMGYGAAREWLQSGRRLDARAAHAAGLVDELVAGDQPMELALRRAEDLARRSAFALSTTKSLLAAAAHNSLADQLEAEATAQARAAATAEHLTVLEGIRRTRREAADAH